MTFIGETEISSAAMILQSRLTRLQLENRAIGLLPILSRTQKRGRRRLGSWELSQLIVAVRGSELLSDRSLREALVTGDPLIQTTLSELRSDGRTDIVSLVGRAWYPGKKWASLFCEVLGFPRVFAGVSGQPAEPAYEEVEPLPEMFPLKDFQLDVKDQTIDVLDAKGHHVGMVSLPTGAGKTRAVVEAALDYMSRGDCGILVWLAQSSEVCEQAAVTFREVYHARRGSQPLPIQRYWGPYELETVFKQGIMVASVQKLYRRLQSAGIIRDIIRGVDAVFFDEGHRAIAPTYNRTLKMLEAGSSRKPLPIIGLTATPGRGSADSEESGRLARRFGRYLIRPRGAGWEDPLSVLQNRGILSEIAFESVKTERTFQLTSSEEAQWEEFKELPPSLLLRIGKDSERNARIIMKLNSLPKDHRGLVFACSVEHSKILALLLRAMGIKAETVTGETRPALRRLLVDRFRNGKMDYICNYGVFSTGFDAPETNVIVLARPTASQVLYEQMIGRGIRGPEFGGTKDCLVIDFEDNIRAFGRPLAYQRFIHHW